MIKTGAASCGGFIIIRSSLKILQLKRMDQEIKKEDIAVKIAFWALIGPVFLIISLFLSSLAPFNADLWLIAVLGIGLCWRFKLKGLVAALCALFAAALLKHIMVFDRHFWQMGLEMSVGLGIATTGIALEHMAVFISFLEKNRLNLLQSIQMLEEELKKAEEFHHKQLSALQDNLRELESAKTAADEHWSEKEDLASELNQKEKELENSQNELLDLKEELAKLSDSQALEKRNRELLDDLNQARCDKTQARLISESLLRMLASGEDVGKEALLKKLDELILAPSSANCEKCGLKTIEHRYAQLRRQFEERKEILHQTRKELFRTKENLLSLEKEKKEDFLKGELFALENSAIYLKEENSHLEDIVSLLSKEKSN